VAQRTSRAYKLKLSDKGIALYLDCHCRLGHLARDLLPYGLTLRVAVELLASRPIEEIVGEISDEELTVFAGKEIRFVGTSPELADLTAQIIADLAASEELGKSPPTWHLFLAALSYMRSAEDRTIRRTYESLLSAHETVVFPAPV
jgi:hypothetical protein